MQKLDGFAKTRRISRALAVPHPPVRAAYLPPAGSRPPGTGPKLACARPLSRRKTSPNGHNILSPDGSRHALQLSSYKRPLKRPLTSHNMPAWPSPSEVRCSSNANLVFLDIVARPVFRTTGLARTAKGSTAARQLCGTRRSHGAAASLSRRAALGGEVA